MSAATGKGRARRPQARPLPCAGMSTHTTTDDLHPAPSGGLAAPLLLGVGLAGLFDGVVFHQLLQWHNMVSAVVPPADAPTLRLNAVADGLFHAVTWLVILIGVVLLWRQARRGQPLPRGRRFAGALLLGAGGFNTVEALLNHHLLGLHNVREVADPLPWNLGFLLLAGGGLAMLGGLLMRR